MFRLPNINHPTDSGKIQQIADFLFQFIRQLNMEQNSAEGTTSASPTTNEAIQPVDYVVEQGTSGIWTYRKWASGIAECWSTGYVEEEVTSWSKAQSSSSVVISNYKLLKTVFFPFRFKSTPSVQVSGYQAVGAGTNALIFSPAANFGSVTCYAFCLGSTASGIVYASYYAIGRWK